MAQAELRVARAEDWLPANPWPWLAAGLASSLLAFLWVNFFREQATLLRLLLVVVGMLCAGGAVALRLNTPGRVFLDAFRPGLRSLATGGLFLLHGALVVFAVLLLLASVVQRSGNVGGLLLLNAVFVPVAGCVAYLCMKSCKTNRSLGRAGESAAVLVLAGLCAFLCCYALYVSADHADEWDTMRLVLAVAAAVAVAGAGLVLLPQTGRRIAVSALILIHFSAILTAVMSAPPTPWVFRQLWARIYRPYLEFMFLNNAYHFYAPEPGPSTFMWFRVEYKDASDPKSESVYRWIDFPKIRDDGTPDYNVALRYQRRLAMTDHIQFWETTLPPVVVYDEQQGKWHTNPIYYWRKVYSDQTPDVLTASGKPHTVPRDQQVPYHPQDTFSTQYTVPQPLAKQNMRSFAYHVFTEPHPDRPGYMPVSVRAYRVVHTLPKPEMIYAGIEPTNPILYRPYYMGKYGMKEIVVDKDKGITKKEFGILDEPVYDPKTGELLSGDPLLYWLLPFLPENNNFDPLAIPNEKIYGYVYRHAGDRNWVLHPGEQSPRPDD